MIGRTNAAGGGKLNHVTGSFTSPSNARSNSFTVSGINFTPKIIAVRRNWSSKSNPDGNSSTGGMIDVLFFDVANSIAFGFVSGDNRHYIGDMQQITPSGSVDIQNGILTVMINGCSAVFSTPDMWNKYYEYGNYTFHIYG